jgi:lambda repressor-like predicted transcriptional regulator
MKQVDGIPTFPFARGSELAHFVQFYEDDSFLMESISHFIGTGLEMGHAGIVIATDAHRTQLAARLRARGLDIAAARKRGQFMALDAAETLEKFLVDGWPDENRFIDVVGSLIARVGGKYPFVRAFGEMVALLWMDGKHGAAIRLEELWNTLGKIHFFSLLCAYPMGGFARDTDGDPFRQVCAEHTHVIPSGWKIS